MLVSNLLVLAHSYSEQAAYVFGASPTLDDVNCGFVSIYVCCGTYSKHFPGDELKGTSLRVVRLTTKGNAKRRGPH